MRADRLSQETCPGWQAISDTGAGYDSWTEYERHGKPDTLRQQFRQISIDVCYICAGERSDGLQSEGNCA